MRRKATILQCDICGRTDTVEYDNSPDEGWQELYIADPGVVHSVIPQPQDLCPDCANRLKHFIVQLQIYKKGSDTL